MTNAATEARARFDAGGLVPPVLFAIVLALAAWASIGTLGSASHEPGGDSHYYLLYMRSVHDQGLSVFPSLFEHWNNDRTSWIFPPPSRVGFIVVSAVWAGIFGASIIALQYLSIAAHLLSSVANYFFARRNFGEPRALFIGALWAFSPLLLGMSHQALTDGLIALCMSVTAWLFLELVQDSESWRRRILFMAALSFTVLVKELAVLILVPFSIFLLVERFARREPIKLGLFAALFAVPGIVIFPIYIAAAGGLAPLLETTRIVLSSPATNAYAVSFGSGPWFRYALDFLCLSPCTTLLAVGYMGVLAMKLKRGEYDRRLVFMELLVISLVFEYSFFTKNLRYAVLFELPLRIMAVCMLGEILKSANALRTTILVGVAVAALCWIDYRAFDLYWVKNPGYDPLTTVLAGIRDMLPPVRR